MGEAPAQRMKMYVPQAVLEHPGLRGLLRGAMNIVLPGGPREIAIRGGPAQGLRMIVDLRYEKAYWLGVYEGRAVRMVQKVVSPGDTVYDVGGHAGYYSLVLARLVGPNGKVIVFEPNPHSASRIRRAIAANGFASRVELCKCAVSDVEGTAELFIPPALHASSEAQLRATMHAAAGPTIEVCSTTLDQVSARVGVPSFVKIDVEDAEARVLAGMKRLLRAARPVLLIEVHRSETGAEVVEQLSRARYSLRSLPEASRYPNDSPRAGTHLVAWPEPL